jgi:N-acetylglutamate synthase-like GNAT family acetyltransferase
MEIAKGFHQVPKGHIAAVVTYLEMRRPPWPVPAVGLGPFSLKAVPHPEAAWYRRLYRRVGEMWLWWSRLTLDGDALEEVIQHLDVEVFALEAEGEEIGLLELDFRQSKQCELAFFGVVPEMIGTGAGRYLMSVATEKAWARPIKRFHVHTCTLDHPSALAFYRRSGFVAISQDVEIAEDPRLTGLLPATAAPHIPIFE